MTFYKKAAYSGKQDLKSIPFHELKEQYLAATHSAVSYAKAEAERDHFRFLQRKEQEWTDSHESPYEGNFSDAIPEIEDIDSIKRAAGKTAVAEFCKEHKLKTKASWFLPQMIAYISNTMKLVRDSNGLIDGGLTVAPWVKSDPFNYGIALLCTHPNRGDFVPSQTTTEFRNYGGMTPLIPSAFKQYQNIPYSDWDRSSLHKAVDSRLCETMLCSFQPLGAETLLKIRDHGRTAQDGSIKKPESCFRLSGLGTTELSDVPSLAATMLCQCWMAVPSIRTSLMVLDPAAWDSLPQPLIDIEVMQNHITSSTPKKVSAYIDEPW